MLDEKDLQAIAALINASTEKTDQQFREIKGEIGELRGEIIEIKGQVKASEKLLLDELGYVQSYFEKQIAQVQKNIDELQQYYKIAKLENDNTTLLLKMIETLQKDIEELKKKTA